MRNTLNKWLKMIKYSFENLPIFLGDENSSELTHFMNHCE